MNRFLYLALGFFVCLQMVGQSFKGDFTAALKAKDMAKAEKILKSWDFADANDPELYVAYFNFYTVKSLEKNPKLLDKENSKKALDFITEGIERFPTRFDMRIAKIYMLEQLRDYRLYTEEILRMLDFSKEIKNSWKGENFTLIYNADDMLSSAILDYQERLFDRKDANLYPYMIQIAERMIQYYPRHMKSRLLLSTVYMNQNKIDMSLETLLKASDIDPSIPVVNYNIAYVYNLKGDKENARKYFKLTIDQAKDEDAELKATAQKQLDALK